MLQLLELNNNSVHTSGQAALSPVSEIDLLGRDLDQKVLPSSIPALGPRAEKSSGWKEGDRQDGEAKGKRERAGSGPEEPGTRMLSGACCQSARRAAVHSGSALVAEAGCILPVNLDTAVVSGLFADIDECADADACGEARCRNLPGSYSCLCDEGYAFSSQEKACRGTHPSRCRHRAHTYIHMHALHVCKHAHCMYMHSCAHAHHTGFLMPMGTFSNMPQTQRWMHKDMPVLLWLPGLPPASTQPAAFGVRPVSSHFAC